MFDKISKLREWLAKNNQQEAATSLVGVVKTAAKKDKLKQLYPGFEADIDFLAASLHTKYLEWASEEVVDGNISAEDIIPIIQRFDHVSKNLDKELRDINVYSSIIRLRKIVEEFGMTESEKKREEKRKVGLDTDFIYKSPRFLVVLPASEEASCYWGKNTQWCIAAVEGGNMFESYSSKNIFFYFVIDKEASNDNKMQRIALPFKNKEVYAQEIRDATDDELTLDEVKEHLGGEWDAIYANIVEDQKNKKYTREGEEFAILEEKLSAGEDLQNVVNEIGNTVRADDFTGVTEQILMMLKTRLELGDPNLISAIINSNIKFKELFTDRIGDIAQTLLVSPGFSKENLVELVEKINLASGSHIAASSSVLSIIKYIHVNRIQSDAELNSKLYNIIHNKVQLEDDLAWAAKNSSDEFIKFVLQKSRYDYADDIENTFRKEAEERGLIKKREDELYYDYDDYEYI
jgi:hypothetical protein